MHIILYFPDQRPTPVVGVQAVPMANPSVIQILAISAVVFYIFVLPFGLHKGDEKKVRITCSGY